MMIDKNVVLFRELSLLLVLLTGVCLGQTVARYQGRSGEEEVMAMLAMAYLTTSCLVAVVGFGRGNRAAVVVGIVLLVLGLPLGHALRELPSYLMSSGNGHLVADHPAVLTIAKLAVYMVCVQFWILSIAVDRTAQKLQSLANK